MRHALITAFALALTVAAFSRAADAWTGNTLMVGGPVSYSGPYYINTTPKAAPPIPGGQANMDAGDECRSYAHETIVAGSHQIAHGFACRRPDGSWQIMD